MAKEAEFAEGFKLPFFPPLECDAKRDVLQFVSTSSSSPTEILKARANELYRCKHYLAAIDVYTNLLKLLDQNENNEQETSDRILKKVQILTNRSFALWQLGFYSSAIEDAGNAIILDPLWLKGYYRIAAGYVGNLKLDIAKTFLLEGIERCCLKPSNSNSSTKTIPPEFTELLTEIEACVNQPSPLFLAQNVNNGRKLQVLSDIPCCSNVQYLHNWHIVDPSGQGDYVSLSDALYAQRYASEVTFILTPGKHLDQLDLTYLAKSKIYIQILGWYPTEESDINPDKAKLSIVHGFPSPDDATTTQKQSQAPRYIHSDMVLMRVVGQNCCINIENIHFVQPVGRPYTHVGACLFVVDGAQVVTHGCTFFSPNSPCLMVRNSLTHLTVTTCRFKEEASAGIVVGYEGHATLRDCVFQGCQQTAVEVRTGGKVDLTSCRFEGCHAQAMTLYHEGHSLTATKCIITHCGNLEAKAGILVESGKLVLKECKFIDNPGDCLVVQQSTHPTTASTATNPIALIKNCIFRHCRTAVAFHCGSGMLVDNEVSDTFGAAGFFLRNLSADKKLAIHGNHFIRNCMSDICVVGDTMYRENVTYDAASNHNGKLVVVPDKLAAFAMNLSIQKLHSLGLQ